MHIHIPDGILPVWFWVSGYAISLFFLFLSLRKMRMEEIWKISVTSAIMLLAMSIPLGLPTHMNLMVFSSFLLGPEMSVIPAFIVNLILAFFGHGGLTIVGWNTILLWFEALAGYGIFKWLKKHFKNYLMIAGVSTFLALLSSTIFFYFLILLSSVEPSLFLEERVIEGLRLEKLEIDIFTFFILTFPIAMLGACVESLVTAFLFEHLRRRKKRIFMVMR